MVETPYALSKFVEAKTKAYGADTDTEFLFNLETETTLHNLDEMLPIAKESLDGIVFGRVDFTLSRGLPRGAINDRGITDAVLTVARVLCRSWPGAGRRRVGGGRDPGRRCARCAASASTGSRRAR